MVNLMTEQEVSKRLNVSVASLRRWRLLNRGPQFLKVGSLVRYQPEELDAWLGSLPTGGTARDEQLPCGPSVNSTPANKKACQ
jgi:Helix-turn-helix domain